jgi:hypothetical protein
MCTHEWRAGAGRCSRENLLGTCARDDGTVEHAYSGQPNNFTTAGVKATCERAGGAWRPSAAPQR